MRQIWERASVILNEGDRDWIQQLPKDLADSDRKYDGLAHIKAIVLRKTKSYDQDGYIASLKSAGPFGRVARSSRRGSGAQATAVASGARGEPMRGNELMKRLRRAAQQQERAMRGGDSRNCARGRRVGGDGGV
jgi:hypothetical protein